MYFPNWMTSTDLFWSAVCSDQTTALHCVSFRSVLTGYSDLMVVEDGQSLHSFSFTVELQQAGQSLGASCWEEEGELSDSYTLEVFNIHHCMYVWSYSCMDTVKLTFGIKDLELCECGDVVFSAELQRKTDESGRTVTVDTHCLSICTSLLPTSGLFHDKKTFSNLL